jgi:ferric-dicitrate binding protein FerR (iron transport regulator)
MLIDKKRIDKLLGLYFSGALEGDARDVVRGWLLSEDDREEKEEALKKLFENISKRNRFPDEYTLASLAVLHDELGFSDRKIRSWETGKNTNRRRFGYVIGSSVAAAVIAGAFFLPGLFDKASPDAPPITTVATVTPANTIITIVADSSGREVFLPDSSTVSLKAGASIRYDESAFAENRTVEIEGEGFFSVTRDELHPFIVTADNLVVKVLGTEFNVKALRSEIIAEVVVKSGSVEVTSGESIIMLEPSQRVTIDRMHRTITRDEIDEEEILWLRGLNLSFEGATLDEALRRTGDFFDVQMRVAPDLPKVNGIVLSLDDNATLDDALFMLQAITLAFDFQIEENFVMITKKK